MPGEEAGQAVIEPSQTAAEPVTTAATEVDTATPESKETEQAKTFTQAELDALVQKRVAREQRRYNREIGELRGRLSAVETHRQPDQQAPQELRQENFETHEEFITAKAERAAVLAVQKLEQQRQAESTQREQQQRLQELDRKFTTSEDKARDKFDDYEDVIETIPKGILSKHIIEYIGEIDSGADLLYHLANEPKELARIARLSPTAAIRELVKREAQIETTNSKTSSAPPPSRPLSGKSASSSDMPSDKDDMNTWAKKEWARMKAAGLLPS